MAFKFISGQTNNNTADFLEKGTGTPDLPTNGVHQTLLDAGWTLLKELNGASGQTDRVYASSGEGFTGPEDNREALYIRITQVPGSNKIRFGIYTFWNAAGAGEQGFNGVRGGAAMSYVAGDGTTPHYMWGSSTPFIAWIVADKDGLQLLTKINGLYRPFGFLLLKNRAVSPLENGITRVVGAVAVTITPAGVAVPVGDATSFRVNQRVFVINQATTSGGGNVLRCKVTAKDTSSSPHTLTLQSESGGNMTFDPGALVAYDPMPVYMQGFTLEENYNCLIKGASFLYRHNMTSLAGVAGTHQANAGSSTHRVHSSIYNALLQGSFQEQYYGYPGYVYGGDPYMSSLLNPDQFGRHAVFPVGYVGSFEQGGGDTGSRIYRGTTSRYVLCAHGNVLNPEDILDDGTSQWLVFPEYFPVSGSNARWGMRISAA